MAATSADAAALKELYIALQVKVRELMEKAQEDEEEDIESSDREKWKLAGDAKELVGLIVELEDKLAEAAPVPSEAAVQKEIERLRQELHEKNQLIRRVRADLDKWTKECVPVEETD